MLRYILRRCAYSVLIMLGVLILTFTLFRVAAGDPAATVLGKNPSPEELEAISDPPSRSFSDAGKGRRRMRPRILPADGPFSPACRFPEGSNRRKRE